MRRQPGERRYECSVSVAVGVETELDFDGQWIATVIGIPGAQPGTGRTKGDAIDRARILAQRKLNDESDARRPKRENVIEAKRFVYGDVVHLLSNAKEKEVAAIARREAIDKSTPLQVRHLGSHGYTCVLPDGRECTVETWAVEQREEGDPA